MAKRRVWLTWLPGETGPEAAIEALSGAGLDVSAAPLETDSAGTAASNLALRLVDGSAPVDLWVIAGAAEDWAKPAHRFELSLAAAALAAERGAPQTVPVLLDARETMLDLPAVMAGRQPVIARGPWAGQVVAAAFRKGPQTEVGFRLGVIAHKLIGTWLEAGPAPGETWAGAVVGVSAPARITAHAVGPRGQLPERCTLEYPTTDIEGELNGTGFKLWSVRNSLSDRESYYLRIEGMPEWLAVGVGDVEGEAADVRLLRLI